MLVNCPNCKEIVEKYEMASYKGSEMCEACVEGHIEGEEYIDAYGFDSEQL